MPSLNQIPKEVKQFAKKFPKFPDGRIDYHTSNIAPVLTCFVQYKDEILLMKRSDKVLTYKGKWNTVAGYLDKPVSLKESILAELEEEVGIKPKDVRQLKVARQPHRFSDRQIGKTWIVYSVLATLKRLPKIRLSSEHTAHLWIKPEDVTKYEIVPRIDRALARLLV